MFRPNSDMLRGIFGLPGQNQNESLQKTDCCNVLSDCCQEVCSAIQRRFPAATGAKVRLWTRSGILKKKSFSKILITPLPRPRLDFRKCVTSMSFYGLLVIFCLAGLLGGSPIENLIPISLFSKKLFFYNIMVTCDQQEKVLSS